MDTEEGSGDDNEDLTLYVTTEPSVDIDDDNDDQENLFLEPQPSSVPVTSSGYYSPAQSLYGGYRGYRVPPPPPVIAPPSPPVGTSVIETRDPKNIPRGAECCDSLLVSASSRGRAIVLQVKIIDIESRNDSKFS